MPAKIACDENQNLPSEGSVVMNRRNFVRSSAGCLAAAVMPGLWSCRRAVSNSKRYNFTSYRPGRFLAPITRVTPDDGFYVHTYYDVCPFSPSQRYLAVTRLPYQDRIPVLGDMAEVCVIDLEQQTIETVYRTKSWGFQTGANLNWGATDRYLYTNDVFDSDAVCVRIDLQSGETKAFAGPMYHMAPDESAVIGFPLELLDITQQGYGVPAKDPSNFRRLPPGASKTEGIWRTDLKSNEKKLLVSLADVSAKIPEPPPRKDGTFYFWHSRFNYQGTRILQVLRCLFPDGWGGRNAMAFTYDADGSDIRHTPSWPVWGHGGGHPNWHPDGEHVIRNLSPDGKNRRFCQLRYDGTEFTVLSEKIPGGGHPRIEPTGKYIVTDAFPHRDGRQFVSLRLVNVAADEGEEICAIPTVDRDKVEHPVFRLDGHPAWSPDYKKVLFQAAPEGARQLFLADLSKAVF
jgi:hypothetical protein